MTACEWHPEYDDDDCPPCIVAWVWHVEIQTDLWKEKNL